MQQIYLLLRKVNQIERKLAMAEENKAAEQGSEQQSTTNVADSTHLCERSHSREAPNLPHLFQQSGNRY